MTASERVFNLLKYTGLSARALANKLGLKGPQIFYDIKAGKCGISKDLADKIQEKFQNINKTWLLTGEGEMLKSISANEFSETDNIELKDYIKNVIGNVIDAICELQDTYCPEVSKIGPTVGPGIATNVKDLYQYKDTFHYMNNIHFDVTLNVSRRKSNNGEGKICLSLLSGSAGASGSQAEIYVQKVSFDIPVSYPAINTYNIELLKKHDSNVNDPK